METQAQARLKAFETMLTSVQQQYDQAACKMQRLKAEGKEKTVAFRQIMATKLQLQNMLVLYEVYGLLENKQDRQNGAAKTDPPVL